MAEEYITLEDAANFEGTGYDTMQKRVNRNQGAYRAQIQPRDGGGRDQVIVALSSLTPKARRAYKASQKFVSSPDPDQPEPRPWYEDVDQNWYIETYRPRYLAAVDLAGQVQKVLDYSDSERTAHAERTAQALGLSLRTLYRHGERLTEAAAWAARLEREDGYSRDYFKAFSLCRKPREAGNFPSLPPEQKALIENIWFNKDFAANNNTFENAFTEFQKIARQRGWETLPSIKTVSRYISRLMDRPGAESAHYLAAHGTREWKNKMMVKCKRDATVLSAMELVVADAHTFDLWVSYTAPNGKVKAIRPVLVAWEDIRSRKLLGPVLCEHSTAQVVKESFLKMCYTAGVPQHIHTDNGKDFTAKEMLGQDRKVRYQEKERVEMDSETMGFYLSMGGTDWSRSLPYQPWDKLIERLFRTFCQRHSKKFKSYVGTLTGSQTADKISKDIPKMLDRGELLSMEEFYDLFMQFLEEDYNVRVHRGLKDAGETWTTPGSLFENAERYEKAPPPREYAAMLLMKAAPAAVTSQGITKFKTLYSADELGNYVNQRVGIKWDIDDVTKLYVYSQDGQKICEAYSAEVLSFGDHVSQEALTAHKRRQNRQFGSTRAFVEEMETPYEERIAEGRAPGVVGKLDLMLGHPRQEKVVTLPVDKEYRGEAASRRKARGDNEFYDRKAEEALSAIRALG